MSKLLFFDTESGNSHCSSICSFGYVLTNENFKIIEEDDLFINPDRKWERRVLDDILYYPKEHYESFPNFTYYYDKIMMLFDDDTLVFGHALNNDVCVLNRVCERYELPYIDFKFYNSDNIYNEFIGNKSKNNYSLDKISEKMGLERQGDKHTSLQDARLVMLQVQRMCNLLEMSITDIISAVDYCDGENKAGQLINSKRPISSELKNNLLKGENNKAFYQLLKTIDVKHSNNSKYNNKIVSIASNYELYNYKEMIYIVYLLAKQGGNYKRQASISDYYVINDCEIVDNKISYVDEAIVNGKNIVKIKLVDFLNDIGFKEEDVDAYYKGFVKSQRKSRKGKQQQSSASLFGDFFSDELKEKLKGVNNND